MDKVWIAECDAEDEYADNHGWESVHLTADGAKAAASKRSGVSLPWVWNADYKMWEAMLETDDYFVREVTVKE